MATNLAAFTLAGAAIVVLPGPDFAVVTRSALGGGRRAGLLAALGVNAGLGCWAAATALGLSALMEASTVAGTAIRVAGAAYLVWLGVQTLRRAGAPELSRAETRISGAAAFRQGMLGNLLNPKAAVIYSSFVPQFVDTTRPVTGQLLMLAGLLSALALAWYVLYALVAAGAGSWLRRPRVRTGLERVSGVALLGFGVRLGLERT